MGKCKICKEETSNIFNIDFDAVHICEYCATRIFIQQAQWYVDEFNKEPNNKTK